MPAPNSKLASVLERRKAAAAAANTKSTQVPVNRPSKVEPAQSRPKVQPLGRKNAPVAEPDMEDEDDEGDEPTPAPVRRTPTGSKSTTLGPRSDRTAARALTVQAAQSGGALAPQGLVPVDRSRQILPTDTLIPRLKLSQAMSKVNTDDQVRQGNFYRSPQNKSMGQRLLMIPVDMYKTRAYFEQGQGVLCRSFDLEHGEGDPGISCEGTLEQQADTTLSAEERGCPLRLWGSKDENGRSSPPPCGLSYNYPVLILDADDPLEGKTMMAIWSLRSTATKIAKAINTILMDEGAEWGGVILEVTVQKQTNPKGTFFVPGVEYFGENAGTALLKSEKFRKQMNAARFKASMEADSGD